MSSNFFLFRFRIWGSDVCHVLCEEFFMFDVTDNKFDVETVFGIVDFDIFYTFTFKCKTYALPVTPRFC